MSLTDEKKIIDMPTMGDIEKFCEQAEQGRIYFEFEMHYYEFDDDGRYMDDWKRWHNDRFGAIPFIDKVFDGCHDLMRLEEYQTVSDIMDRVCELQFPVKTAEDSEEDSDEDFFSLADADKENMFSRRLEEAGADWIRAVAQLTGEQDNRERAGKLLELLEHPVCQKVKPRILLEEGLPREIFFDMMVILEGEIAEREAFLEGKTREEMSFRERYRLGKVIDRKKEMLLDIRVKCLGTISDNTPRKESKLAACWEQIKEGIKWLSYEPYIDDQPEIDTIQNICEALIRTGQLDQEDWEVRKKVLKDMIHNEYYERYNCQDVMLELAQKMCTTREEYLVCADIMDASKEYKEQAAYLYYQYGRDDKYISYLETHLDRRSKEYSALITYYQTHDRQEDARRVAEQGLERCREDLTDSFICLLLDAQKGNDQKRFQKLYASAKRRKHVDIEAINSALSLAWNEKQRLGNSE